MSLISKTVDFILGCGPSTEKVTTEVVKIDIDDDIKLNKEAKEVRFYGVVVNEESYPSIVGKGMYSRAETVISRVWGFHGKFTGDLGPLLSEWQTKDILGKIIEELPQLCQEEQMLQQDLQLNLSSDGKKLIEERMASLKIRIEIIKKALPI